VAAYFSLEKYARTRGAFKETKHRRLAQQAQDPTVAAYFLQENGRERWGLLELERFLGLVLG
jgi:hypothetical protein